MQAEAKLKVIKTIHTLVWIFMNFVIFYMVYAVTVNKLNGLLWIGYGIVLLEGLVLLAFNYSCPLTIIAHKYSNSTADNFDIYLPNWLAKHNKLIYTGILIVVAVITICRLLNQIA